MSKKVFSYCFFKPLTMPKMRFWDSCMDDFDRYYYNIPAVLLSNLILFPDYTTRIYITDNILENSLSEIFNVVQSDLIEFYEIKLDYKLTEPMVFRMEPLWSEIDMFHTRDMDSVPTEIEYRYLKCFEKSGCGVGTMRTHQNHYGFGCCMMGGLSSFVPHLVPEGIKGPSFDDYYNNGHGNYGMDQDLLISYFTKNNEYTKDYFYDCMSYKQTNKQHFPCKICSHDDLQSIDVEDYKMELFEKLKSCGHDNWAGEPIDARGEYTDFVLDKFPEVRKSIKQNDELRKFYGQ